MTIFRLPSPWPPICLCHRKNRLEVSPSTQKAKGSIETTAPAGTETEETPSPLGIDVTIPTKDIGLKAMMAGEAVRPNMKSDLVSGHNGRDGGYGPDMKTHEGNWDHMDAEFERY